MRYFIIYLIIINIVSCLMCIADKRKAVKHKRRISEKALFTVSILGGSPLMYLTMLAIRHKTLHKPFMVGIPLILLGPG